MKKRPDPEPKETPDAVYVVPESRIVQYDLLRNKMTFNLTDAYKAKLNIHRALEAKMLKPMRDDL